jgi:hypothetical protein
MAEEQGEVSQAPCSSQPRLRDAGERLSEDLPIAAGVPAPQASGPDLDRDPRTLRGEILQTP